MSAYLREHKHIEKRVAKQQRINGLRALLETHEKSKNPDWVEVFQLIERIKRAEKQLEHMRP